MGWCHEFGPQIHDGCDHPMVAGTAACSCAHCGSTCHGKFDGCVGVWARGPRPVIVGVAAAESSGSSFPQVALAPELPEPPELLDVPEVLEVLEIPDVGASPMEEFERVLGLVGDGDDHSPASVLARLSEKVETLEARLSAVDQESAASASLDELVAKMTEHLDGLSSRVLELEAKEAAPPERSVQTVVEDALKGVDQRMERLSSQLASLEALPSRTAEPERAGEMVEDKVTEMMSERLLPLASALTALEGFPERLTALEEGAPGADQPALPAGLVEDVERLSAQVATLKDLPQQVDLVKKRLAGVPDPTTLTDMVDRSGRTIAHLDRLSSQLAPMQAVPKRVEAVEKALGRVNALQKVVAGLVHGDQQRSATMAIVEGLPERLAALEHLEARIGVLDSGLTDVSLNLEQLSAELSALGDVPKRLESLERCPSAPTQKLLDSVTERLDLLASHTAQLQDVPERLAGVEVGSSTRNEIVQKLFMGISAELNEQKVLLQGLPERLDHLEDSAVRTSALASGLGAAIDMLDQLAAQVATLEPPSATGPAPQVDPTG